MNFFETLRSAIQNIFANKMRTLLTTLGIIIGISSVIIITSLGSGMQTAMNDQFSNISSQFYVSITNSSDVKPTGKDKLTLKDVELTKTYPGVKYVSPQFYGWGNDTIKLLDPTKTKKSQMSGVTPDAYYINDNKLLYGRYIAEADIMAKSNVVVIHDTTAMKVYGYKNAVGQKISVKGYFGTKKYTIIGIIENPNSPEMEAMYGEFWSETLYAPITTVMNQFGEKYINGFYVKIEDKEKLAVSSAEVVKLIEKAHGNEGKKMYYLNDPTSQINQINQMFTMFTLFITFVAAISLLVGGIGVMNIMMVTVTERTREIGIRKSIGARNSDIRVQFIVEAIILTTIGGLLGIFVGILGGNGLAGMIPEALIGAKLTAVFTPSTMLIAVGVSSLIGIIFGVYPANKAAKLDPIDALRYE